MIPAWLAAASAPFLCIAAAHWAFKRHSENLAHSDLHPIGWGLVVIAMILMLVIAVFASANISLSIWRFVKSRHRYKNE
ncbi:MAG: hypothetical protein AAF996_14330 [Pseudomonadota bacterium]